MKHFNRTHPRPRMPLVRLVILFLALVGIAEQTAVLHIKAFQEPTTKTQLPATDDLSTLNPEKPVTREMQRGKNHFYEFSLSAGLFMHAIVEQQGIDVSLTIYDRDNNVV